ncbi:putative zinc-binding metallopeptidase [Rhodococcus sp. BP-349]|uniref:zinc-binding metallopeptidase family protein n=1 Tax=unclassified Rhodococcus (in: high G+C Gram-positive bacteria) TaxID=192944 RepID=UPI001C9BAC2E|nr:MULTISPECIES: putative zinc-binding metallopeptidase [unclassified Rhodococcus (in: high G+C Gram-positive bacteria)]MBY6539368.1 putative zinc-binding metallopeptidase [Rhodococcus sp. BP-363]MBY6544304.1 putative zinc-binding metallopeptidase [Rhodococcus sp. BP-369]MBY6563534.1 putative zinc-binding metallopeptidase [Rhodococcus sp. BP-370]MBY6577826.1 putative zinc-binding metallopeptidase [Rhodococcus sp. BP-364]MBY6587127.1 putative zinc-binding metallopeptidase [Rhodococcus sp. BP-35
MRVFFCRKCGQQLSFENSICLSCDSRLGFHLPSRSMQVLDDDLSVVVDGTTWRRCANIKLAQCNWLVDATDGATLCLSCALTRTRPADTDQEAIAEFASAETAKRRVVLELDELHLPIIGRDENPEGGLAFDLLSSANRNVITGHANGLITLDLAESDDVHREQLRVSMDEPYRTLVGHFRHEIGHFYQMVLIGSGEHRARFEELFGNPDDDYQAALDRHYSEGAPDGWKKNYVSSYATMHPAEDWAETFAHYLHIRDTLDTAAAYAFAPAGSTFEAPLAGDVGFSRIIDWWLPLTWALNQLNRSMGHQDLYPFVLPAKVLEKMRFVHSVIVPDEV